jgi:hypothetical protein
MIYSVNKVLIYTVHKEVTDILADISYGRIGISNVFKPNSQAQTERSSFVFERCSVGISGWTPAIQTEIIRSF